MFRLDMQAIRQNARTAWLMANPAIAANSANPAAQAAGDGPEISQKPPELARLAGLAISQQVGHESAELLTARLIASAMRACDHHGDGPAARADMQCDCLATPLHLQADLLKHFQQTYASSPAQASDGPAFSQL